MARTTSVSVERVVLVKRLKERVKSIPKDLTDYDNAQKAYRKEVEQWVLGLLDDPKNIKTTEPSKSYRDEHTVVIKFTTKAMNSKPKYVGPEEPNVSGYQTSEAIRTLTNTINILELSSDEFVGVSILNKVSQYL